MTSEQTPVVVTILGREYRIACPPQEKEGLVASAEFLDAKMREIRSRGRTQGMDNIAVMAALNIAHELLQSQGEIDEKVEPAMTQKVRSLQNKIQTALNDARQIEL